MEKAGSSLCSNKFSLPWCHVSWLFLFFPKHSLWGRKCKVSPPPPPPQIHSHLTTNRYLWVTVVILIKAKHIYVTFLNSPVCLYSHSIISKKIGMVAFRSSASGIRVISRIGPTIPGINRILFCPKTKHKRDYQNRRKIVIRMTCSY